MNTITLTIDGQTVTAQTGATVLQAAQKAGIFVPTLCDHKDLSPYGACRMCIVEIDGVRGFPTSCTTPAAEGMVVRTQTEELTSLRNRTLEFMLSGHPDSCLNCLHREDCERYRPVSSKGARTTRCVFCANREVCDLRGMALAAGPRELNLPTLYSGHLLERDDPFMDRDYNLCILCGRCWRICEKIHGTPAISVTNRGKEARVNTAFGRDYLHSGCTFCGACVDICPTGTLSDRFARWRGAAETEMESVCMLCPLGCTVNATAKGGGLLAYTMPEFNSEAKLCALGRFATAQLLASPQRLIRPLVRMNGVQIPVDMESAVKAAASALQAHAGKAALAVSATSFCEDRFLYQQLAKALNARLMVFAAEAGPEDAEARELAKAVEKGTIQVVLANGPFLPAAVAEKLAALILIDCLPSPLTAKAEVLLPVAVLAEAKGSFRNSAGAVRKQAALARPPAGPQAEWHLLCMLGQALGLKGFAFKNEDEIAKQSKNDPAPAPAAPAADPRKGASHLNPRFRGHLLADIIPALEAFGLPVTPAEAAAAEMQEGGFAILEKREIVPNMHFFKILAPQVARFAKPGQFVILMAGETSERSPFTLVDWDAEEGSISLIIEELGRSTRELAALKTGGRIAHISGPLGMPLEIEKKGTVVLGGGCYGVGAIYPMARALREAGNKVICVIEASSAHLLYMEEQISGACDRLMIATKDGGRGIRGGIQEALKQLAQEGTKVDQCIAIGCTFMMRMVTMLTKELNIPTLVALNPIMVDGTGMCGACRVSVGAKTLFACVDGPIFDGHAVDWDELDGRRSAYAPLEVEALPQHGVELPMWRPSGAENGNTGTTASCGCGRRNA